MIQALENCGIDQMVDFPTTERNLQDIFCANRPSVIQTCSPLPGIRDYEIVRVDSVASTKYKRPVKRTI